MAARECPEFTIQTEFFGPSHERLFGSTYIPRARAHSAALIVSSVLEEARKNYRAETLLAEDMASRGIAVQRFHFLGTGHSDGSTMDVTLSSMTRDAVAAEDQLRRLAGLPVDVLVGCRVGALVAAATAESGRHSRIIFWDPVSRGDDMIKDALRALKISYLAASTRSSSTSTARPRPDQALEDDGFVDVLGYPLTKMFCAEAQGRQLPERLAPAVRSVLLVELRSAGLQQELSKTVAAWRAAGVDTTTISSCVGEAWWLAGDPRAGDGALGGLRGVVEDVATWTAQRVEAGVVR